MTMPFKQAYSLRSTCIERNLAIVSWRTLISAIAAMESSLGDLSGDIPAAVNRDAASIGNWNWAAPSTNISLHPSSKRLNWSPTGSRRKAGVLFIQLRMLKSILAAASQTDSAVSTLVGGVGGNSWGYWQKMFQPIKKVYIFNKRNFCVIKIEKKMATHLNWRCWSWCRGWITFLSTNSWRCSYFRSNCSQRQGRRGWEECGRMMEIRMPKCRWKDSRCHIIRFF